MSGGTLAAGRAIGAEALEDRADLERRVAGRPVDGGVEEIRPAAVGHDEVGLHGAGPAADPRRVERGATRGPHGLRGDELQVAEPLPELAAQLRAEPAHAAALERAADA